MLRIVKTQEANAFKNLSVLIKTDPETFAALITINQEGLTTEFNPVAERLTGFSREEALGRPSEEILHIVENTRASGT